MRTTKTPPPASLAGRIARLDATRAEYFAARREWLFSPSPRPLAFARYITADQAHRKAFTYARTANKIPA